MNVDAPMATTFTECVRSTAEIGLGCMDAWSVQLAAGLMGINRVRTSTV